MRYTDPALLEHLASTYALGTLSGGARRRFERLQRDRADVRALVSHWEARLGQLAPVIPSQRPSPRVWAAIAARTQKGRSPSPQRAPRLLPGWLSPAGWGMGGMALGVAAMAALWLAVPTLLLTSEQIALRSGDKLPPSYVGLLTDAQGNGKLLVSSLRHGKTMIIKVLGPIAPVPLSAPSGRLVLWAVPTQAPAFMLGTISTTGSSLSLLPDSSEKLLSQVSKLVVTLETQAEPTRPSNTIVLSGNCAKLW